MRALLGLGECLSAQAASRQSAWWFTRVWEPVSEPGASVVVPWIACPAAAPCRPDFRKDPLHVPANNVSSEQHCTPPALPRAAGLQVPCSNWTAGANNACPTSCTLTPAGSLTTPAVIDLTGCAACIDGQTGFALTCYRCKPGFVHLYHSFDRQVSRRRLHAFGSRRQPLQWRHCHATA